MLEYPQSGERIRGQRNIQASCFAQPNRKHFTVRRMLGAADLWTTELVLHGEYRAETGSWPARPNTSAIRVSQGIRVLNGSSGCAET